MNSINTGIVVATEFCSPEDDAYQGYIDYMDRSEATRKEHFSDYNIFERYLNYMDNDKKTSIDGADIKKMSALFTDEFDNLSKEQKRELKKVYQTAQKNGSLMWETIISFDNAYLEKLGVYDSKTGQLNERVMKQVTRKAINAMLDNEGLNNATWSSTIHYNTDNIHIHVASVEAYPTRERRMYKQYVKVKEKGKWQYKMILNKQTGRKEKIPILDRNGKPIERMEYKGKFSSKSIKLCKRSVEMELNKDKELNKEMTTFIRERLVKGVREGDILEDDKLRTSLMNLYEKLPHDVSQNLWKYNANIMKPYKAEIDKISRLYIKKYHEDDFNKLMIDLNTRGKQYKESYGSDNNFVENKIKDLYSRLGNSILRELIHYDKTQNKSNINAIKADAGGVNAVKTDTVGINAVRANETKINGVEVDTARAEKYDSENVIAEEDLPDFLHEYIDWSNEYKKARELMFKYKNYEAAINIFLSEHNKGNALATYELGAIYGYGRGVDIDYDISNQYYMEALDSFKSILIGCNNDFKEKYLSYRIGKMYHYGLGIEQDYEEAYNRYLDSGDSPYAQYGLGILYFEGLGIDKDEDRAIELFKAASKKNPYAAYKLGDIYSKEGDNESAQKYYKGAFEKFKKLEDEGDDNLKYKIGVMYLKGLGVPENLSEAINYFKESMDFGNPYAAYRISRIYLESEEVTEEDLNKAIELLEKAAYKGKNVMAKYALGEIYSNEKYGRIDMKKAVDILKEAAIENNIASINLLGKIYADKNTDYYNINEAIKCFKEAAAQDNEYAQYRLGKIYLSEEHYDEDQGVYYLKKSCEQGNIYAKYAMGSLLVDKKSKHFNVNDGLMYLKNAAEEGNDFASLKIGILYLKGEVVKKDIAVAKSWLQKAHDAGNPIARDILKSIDLGNMNITAQIQAQIQIGIRNNDFDMAMRFLRRSMNNSYESWRNQQEYEELQRKIAKDKTYKKDISIDM